MQARKSVCVTHLTKICLCVPSKEDFRRKIKACRFYVSGPTKFRKKMRSSYNYFASFSSFAITEAYLELSRTVTMDDFAKIVNG